MFSAHTETSPLHLVRDSISAAVVAHGGRVVDAAVTSARAAAVARSAPVAQQLIGDARRDGVDRVVEGVDRDLLRRPENGRRGDAQRAGSPARCPRSWPGRRWKPSRRRGGTPSGMQQSAHHSPAGAVAPVRKVIETRTGDVIGEGCDPQRFGRRAGREPACGAGAAPRACSRPSSPRSRRPPATSPLPMLLASLSSGSHESTSWSRPWDARLARGCGVRAESLEQVVADPQRVRHRGQRRVDGAAGKSSCPRRRGCQCRGPGS